MRLGSPFVARIAVIVGLAATSFVVYFAHADDLRLKDGTKITGTIVGFDDNSFRVKTNYGFAVVQKDQVVSINIGSAAKSEDTEKKSEPTSEKAPAPAPAKPTRAEATSVTGSSDSSAPLHAHADPVPDAAAAAKATSTPVPAAKKNNATAMKIAEPSSTKNDASHATTAVPSAATAASASPPVSANALAAPPIPPAPPKPTAPEPIRESVNGNMYMNETYGFQMYKPPDWEVIASASTLMPGAIAAMGTGDQTTYLLVGQGPAGKTMASDEDAADRRLRAIMENFRPLEVQHVTISGSPAIQRRFRGNVDQHDWSGVVVLVPRGSQLYTIFGMTIADTDLVQIQENVIARAISSLRFTKQ
jgi:hypothetical protein